jgi:gliding motility associated protien GldN
MNKLIIKISSILLSNIAVFTLVAQGGTPQIGPSNIITPQNSSTYPGVVDGVYTKKDVLAKKRAIPYEFVRENDYVWGKRTWSYIDLREKINHPLYYPHEELNAENGNIQLFSQGRYSLFLILRQAILEQKIWGFFDSKPEDKLAGINVALTNGDGFQYPCKVGVDYKSDAEQLISDFTVDGPPEMLPTGQVTANNDPIYAYWKQGSKAEVVTVGLTNVVDVFDPNILTADSTQAEKLPSGVAWLYRYRIKKPVFFQPKDIIKYLLKEDWFFDKERSILDVRTIGLAPVIQGDTAERILFWVYFPQARDVLKNYYVYDAKSTVGGNTYDHLFMTRRFNAVVYKESTLYDRKIEDYRFGADALYESEKVKNTIRTFEHDVWNF